MKYILLLLALVLSGCAGMHTNIGDIECAANDLGCIDKQLDESRFDGTETDDLYDYMEGYEPASLQELKELGRLEVKEIHPGYPIAGIIGLPSAFAYTKLTAAPHGDIQSAAIYYPSWMPGANRLYAHEARHVQGFKGFGFHGINPGYTDTQEEIMEAENVDSWIDTEFYKNDKDNKYHWVSE